MLSHASIAANPTLADGLRLQTRANVHKSPLEY